MGRRGLGVGPIKAMEQGRRPAHEGDLRAVAKACAIPEDFFYKALGARDSIGYRLMRIRESRGGRRLEVEEILRDYVTERAGWRGADVEELPADAIEVWENGAAIPSEFMLTSLCDVLGVSLRELVPPAGDDVIRLRVATTMLEDKIEHLEFSLRQVTTQLDEARAESARSRGQLDTTLGLAKDAAAQARRMEWRESIANAEARVAHLRVVLEETRRRRAESEVAMARDDPAAGTPDDELDEREFAVRDVLRNRNARLASEEDQMRERLSAAEHELLAQRAAFARQAEAGQFGLLSIEDIERGYMPSVPVSASDDDASEVPGNADAT